MSKGTSTFWQSREFMYLKVNLVYFCVIGNLLMYDIMNYLYSVYSTCVMPQAAHDRWLRDSIWHRSGEICQSNVLNWSATNSHSPNPTKHMWQQGCDMQWLRTNSLFHSIQNTPSDQQDFNVICLAMRVTHVWGMKYHYSKHWKYNTILR